MGRLIWSSKEVHKMPGGVTHFRLIVGHHRRVMVDDVYWSRHPLPQGVYSVEVGTELGLISKRVLGVDIGSKSIEMWVVKRGLRRKRF